MGAMKRAAKEQQRTTTFVAPYRMPEWLQFAAGSDIVVPMVEVDADVLFTDDPFPEWMPLSDKAKKSYFDALSMEPKAARDIYFRAVSGRDDLERELLDAIGVRYNGAPVWWVDLERGPVRAATLLDLHRLASKPQPWPYDVKKKKKPTKWMYLLSLEQWDSATYPPASKGGPPFVKGVSTAAERLRRRRKTG